MLLQKSRQEYQEAINCWKTVDHVMGIMLRPRGRPQRTFLEKFYEGAFGCSWLIGYVAHLAPFFQAGTRTRFCQQRLVSFILRHLDYHSCNAFRSHLDCWMSVNAYDARSTTLLSGSTQTHFGVRGSMRRSLLRCRLFQDFASWEVGRHRERRLR